jgi:acetyl esterase
MNGHAAITRPPAQALHPQCEEFLRQAHEAGVPALHTLSPADARAVVDASRDVVGPGPSVQRVTDIVIDGAGQPIPARVYAPAQSQAEIVWFHGGGWVLGGLDSHDAMCRMLANAAQCTVTSVDYRLAPEHPFPAALQDCWTALTWVTAGNASGESPRPVVVGGDSAGGNLAAVCSLRARDCAAPAPALQVLVYPVTDGAMNTGSYAEHGDGDAFLTREEMEWFFDLYVPDQAQRESTEVSPLRAPDLSGLPPAVVVTAGHDPLLDEALAYIARLQGAAVPVIHRHYGDMVHAFFSFVNVFARGDEAVLQVAHDIRVALDQGSGIDLTAEEVLS